MARAAHSRGVIGNKKMKWYFFILFITLAKNNLAQTPRVEYKNLQVVVSYEFEGKKQEVYNDKVIIGCPKKTVVITSIDQPFYDNRETNYKIFKEYSALEEGFTVKEKYLDNSEFYVHFCRDDSIDNQAMVYSCDSILIEYQKKVVDHPNYFSRDWSHRYNKIYSQNIYVNESGNFEIVFGIEMRCLEYFNVDLFLREKNDFQNQENPQPPKNERCPFPEVSDNFIVVEEIFNYFQPEKDYIKSRKLTKLEIEKIYIPIVY